MLWKVLIKGNTKGEQEESLSFLIKLAYQFSCGVELIISLLHFQVMASRHLRKVGQFHRKFAFFQIRQKRMQICNETQRVDRTTKNWKVEQMWKVFFFTKPTQCVDNVGHDVDQVGTKKVCCCFNPDKSLNRCWASLNGWSLKTSFMVCAQSTSTRRMRYYSWNWRPVWQMRRMAN